MFGVYPAYAQESTTAQKSQKEKPYDVPKGALIIYGQTLNPYLDFFEKPEGRGYQEDAYVWDDVRYLVPDLLPGARTKKMSAGELCDSLVPLKTQYAILAEEAVLRIATRLAPYFPEHSDMDLMDEAIMRLISKKESVYKELKEMLKDEPNVETKIMMAKTIIQKSMAMTIMHDAAIANCPDRAKEKNYIAETAPYLGDDIPKN